MHGPLVSFVPSVHEQYRRLEHAVRERSADLIDVFAPPVPERSAAYVGELERPYSSALVSAYEDLGLELGTALGLWLERNGTRCTDTIGSLTSGPLVHIELIESFVPGRGYARAIIEAIANDADVIASPLEDALPFYERCGFDPLDIYDSSPERPLMFRGRNR